MLFFWFISLIVFIIAFWVQILQILIYGKNV